MKRAKRYPTTLRRWYRPVEHECAVCHRRLRQAMTLSRRTVVTLQAVIKLIHAGYRCPDPQCLGRSRIYRSVEADALALPGFTYGLDIVVLVGQLHLGKHQTVDEVHQEVQDRLRALGVSISRREILYLFDAYCTLLKASSEAKADLSWLAQVEASVPTVVFAARDEVGRDVTGARVLLDGAAVDVADGSGAVTPAGHGPLRTAPAPWASALMRL